MPRNHKSVVAAIIGASLIFGAAGCAQPNTGHIHMPPASKRKLAATKPSADKRAGSTVTISAGRFIPADLTARAGDAVTWVNEDSQAHEVHADDEAFHSPRLEPGGSFSQKFTVPGDFGYHDHLHEEIKGTIKVD